MDKRKSFFKSKTKDTIPKPTVETITNQSKCKSTKSSKEQQMIAVQSIFALFDRDGNGSISRAEIAELLRGTGVQYSNEQLSQFVEKLDSDGDGEITYKEFCHILKETVCDVISTTSNLRSAFDRIDKNGDGKVDEDELFAIGQTLGQSMSRQEVKEVMNVIDKDGDGTIDFDEFVAMIYLLEL